MRIGLVVDSPQRDTMGLLLVAYHLLKEGHTVFLIPMYQMGFDPFVLNIDSIIVNYARPNNIPILKQMHKQGIQVSVLDTEGGVLSEDGLDSPENWAKEAENLNLHDFISNYFFWGPRVYDAFKKYSKLSDSSLKLTGCPRYDFCHSRWNSILSGEDNDYILVNMNFSATNPKFSHSEENELKTWTDIGWEENYARQQIHELNKVFPKYLDVISQIAKDFPEQKILVRPHPFEGQEIYREHFKEHINIKVECKGDVLNVIKHCRIMLHLNCGSSVETNMLGKTPVSLEFLNTDFMRRHTPLPTKVSLLAKSYDELKEWIAKPEDAERIYDRKQKYTEYINEWFAWDDGNAAHRVANYTHQNKPNKQKAGLMSQFITATKMGRNRPNSLQVLQGLLCQILGSSNVAKARGYLGTRKYKFIELKLVREILYKIKEIENEVRPIKISQAKNPLFQTPLASLKMDLLSGH